MKKTFISKILGTALLGAMAVTMAACGNASAAGAPSSVQTQSSAETTTSAEKNESASEAQGAEKTGEPKALRIGIMGTDGSTTLDGAALAVNDGYLEEELKDIGYYPEYVYFTGGPAINEAFAGGSIDAAIVGDLPTFTARSNGIENTIIAVTNQKVNYAILTTVEGAENIQDLKDYTAVVFNGTITQYFWENYLKENGIAVTDIAAVNSPDGVTLLTSGDAQIYPVTGYVAYYLEANGLGHTIDISDSDIHTTFVFEINSNIIRSDPDVGIAVNKALIRGAEASKADPQKFYKESAGSNFDAASWEKYYSADPTLSNLTPEITDDLIKYYEDENQWLLDNGVITTPVDVNTFVDASFYQKALEALGR